MFLFIVVTIAVIIASVLFHLGAAQFLITLWAGHAILKRWRIATLIVAFILVHMVEIGFFAIATFILLNDGSYGSLEGVITSDVGSLYYYSAITYTTVGYGDITPLGDIRLFAATEALTGMVLVAWTASVIFTVMQNIVRQERKEEEEAEAAASGD
jgi:hypothetical protein